MSKCSNHPDAPHGFNRSASHADGRYVCDCEGWIPDDEENKMNDIETIDKAIAVMEQDAKTIEQLQKRVDDLIFQVSAASRENNNLRRERDALAIELELYRAVAERFNQWEQQ